MKNIYVFSKILKYTSYDLLRSRWSYVYFFFYLLLGFVLLFINHDLSKAIVTLMNIILVLTPLIGTVFGVMYYYNSQEFTTLLLAQPIQRNVIFMGHYVGVSLSLTASLVLGLGIPFALYGLFKSSAVFDFTLLLGVGAFLNFIFVAFAFNIALRVDDKVKGFAYAMLMWLLFALVYDGIFLISLLLFDEYPLDKLSLVAVMLNPIDLSRVLILLKLDISALLGYTGAVFKQFFNTGLGMLASTTVLMLWILLSVLSMVSILKKKDF